MLVCVHKLMQNSKGELQSWLLPRQQESGAEPSQPQSQKLGIPLPETQQKAAQKIKQKKNTKGP